MSFRKTNPDNLRKEKICTQPDNPGKSAKNEESSSPAAVKQTAFEGHSRRPGDHLLGPDVYVLSMQKRMVGMEIPSAKKQASTALTTESWQCLCGTINSRNFCTECGKKRP